MITRRALITGLVSLMAAPAIVRVSSLMPVRPWRAPVIEELDNWYWSREAVMDRMFWRSTQRHLEWMKRFEEEYPFDATNFS